MNISVWNKLLAGWFLLSSCDFCGLCFVLRGGADCSSLISFVWSRLVFVGLYPLTAHLALLSSLTSSTYSHWPQLRPSPLTSGLSRFFQLLKEGVRVCSHLAESGNAEQRKGVLLTGWCPASLLGPSAEGQFLRVPMRDCPSIMKEVGELFPLGKLEEQQLCCLSKLLLLVAPHPPYCELSNKHCHTQMIKFQGHLLNSESLWCVLFCNWERYLYLSVQTHTMSRIFRVSEGPSTSKLFTYCVNSKKGD